MGHYHGCVQETLMRSHNNMRSKVGDQDPIIKCKPFGIYLMSVDL